MTPGKFSSVRVAWLLDISSAVWWLISGCAISLRFASRSALLQALGCRRLVSQFRLFLLMYVARDTSSIPVKPSGWDVTKCVGDACTAQDVYLVHKTHQITRRNSSKTLEETARRLDTTE